MWIWNKLWLAHVWLMEQIQHSSTGENQGNLVDVPSVSHPNGRSSALPCERGSVSAGHFISSTVTGAEACGDQALLHGWTRVSNVPALGSVFLQIWF